METGGGFHGLARGFGAKCASGLQIKMQRILLGVLHSALKAEQAQGFLAAKEERRFDPYKTESWCLASGDERLGDETKEWSWSPGEPGLLLLLLLLQGMEKSRVTAVTSLTPSRSKSLSHGTRYELMFE